MQHLAHLLVEAAANHGGRRAMKLDDLEFTYEDLFTRASVVAQGLRDRGLAPGDRIALVVPNVPGYAVAFFGAQLADLVVVPINPLSKEREVSYFVEDSGAKVVFAYQGSIAEQVRAADTAAEVIITDDVGPVGLSAGVASRQLAQIRQPSDTAVILYTSGTTGRSKGAELMHSNLISNAQTTANVVTELSERDVIMGCLPLFHSFGLTCAMNATFAKAACLTLTPRFDADRVLEVMQRDAVTVFLGVPTMYSALLQATKVDKRLPALRACLSGGASLPVEVMRAFESTFDCIILEGYGLSETSPAASFNLPSIPRKPGTVGPSLPGVEMKIVDDSGSEVKDGDVGEIVIRGVNLMKGYWRRPEASAEAVPDTWFRTGDLGTRDEDGYFSIVDRKKDMIIRGGYNVYPREVEEVLYEHPDVTEAAVVGISHPELGQEVAAAVVLRPHSSATAESIREHVRSILAAYKYPRQIWLMDELPKGPTGKILRRELRGN